MKLVPYKSCGAFYRGMTYDEVKTKFPDHTEFKKTKESEHVTSKVMEKKIHVYYSSNGKCIGIELWRPKTLEWNGINIGDRTVYNLISILKKKGLVVEEDDYGFKCKELGIATFTSAYTGGEADPVDGVYVTFEDDFFELQ